MCVVLVGVAPATTLNAGSCPLPMARWANWFAVLCFIALSTVLSSNEQLKQQALR